MKTLTKINSLKSSMSYVALSVVMMFALAACSGVSQPVHIDTLGAGMPTFERVNYDILDDRIGTF